MFRLGRSKFAGTVVVVVMFAAIVAGCGDVNQVAEMSDNAESSTSKDGEEAIQIGTLFPHSGDLAWAGPQFHAAVTLAFDLVNESGGVNGERIEAVLGNTGTSEQLATDAASVLMILHGVPVIIGAVSSGVTVAVAESVTIPSGVLLISPASASNAITALQDGDLVFRTVVSDSVQGEVAAQWALMLGWERVARPVTSTTRLETAFRRVSRRTSRRPGER